MDLKRMMAFIMLVIILVTVPCNALADPVGTTDIAPYITSEGQTEVATDNITDVTTDENTDEVADGMTDGASGETSEVSQGGEVQPEEVQPGGDIVTEPEIVEITEDMAFDNIIPKEKFQEADGTISTEMAAVIINMTDDVIIGSKNALEEYNSIDFAELMTLYTALKLCKDTSKVVTVTQQMLTPVKNSLYLSGFQVNDQITYRDLILCYMFTRTDDSRSILVNSLKTSEEKFVAAMNRYASDFVMDGSDFVATDGKYNDFQFTSIYDMYILINKLAEQSLFRENYRKASVTIAYTRNEVEQKLKCKSFSISKYGQVTAPDGYNCIWQFTGGSNSYGFNGMVLLEDEAGKIYLAVFMCPDFTKEISEEMSRLLQIIVGGSFDDKIYGLDLPTESNEARHQYLLGVSEDIFTSTNRPTGYETAAQASENMMKITVPVWKMNADKTKVSSTYELTVHRKLANSVKAIYDEIYALDIKFPIRVMKGYNYRMVGGVGLSNSTLMSMHAFGSAIDINYGDYDNDYFLGAGNDMRDKENPYCIPDEVIEIFEKHGWNWGGYFSICVDSMHFQYLGLEYLTYQNNSPFKDYSIDMKGARGVNVENLQERLVELGFNVNIDGVYTYATANAVRKFQAKYDLPVTGEVDYKTWETVINLTHYMPYVF